jgi:hypothetical protein
MVCSGEFIRRLTDGMAAEIHVYVLPHYRELTPIHVSNILNFWRLSWFVRLSQLHATAMARLA